MSLDSLPPGVLDLIARSIKSVSHIEVLMCLRHDPDRMWSAQELARQCRTNASMVESQMRELGPLVATIGSSPSTYRYNFESEISDDNVKALLEHYRTHSRSVLDAIYSNPIDTIRSFADAFKIKKD